MARFNKGDHVKVISGPWKGYHGSVATPKTDAGKVEVTLSKGGGHIQMSFFTEDELAANSCLNAKFKVGDRVRCSRSGVYPTKDDVGVVVELHPDSKAVTVKSEKYGHDIDYHENELVASNSSNPVVRNAVAWKAKNAIKVGDKVKDKVHGWSGELKGIYGDRFRAYDPKYGPFEGFVKDLVAI